MIFDTRQSITNNPQVWKQFLFFSYDLISSIGIICKELKFHIGIIKGENMENEKMSTACSFELKIQKSKNSLEIVSKSWRKQNALLWPKNEFQKSKNVPKILVI